MRKVIFLTIVSFVLVSAAIAMDTNSDCISTTLIKTEQEPSTNSDDFYRGHRTGTAPIVCSIGIDDLIISGTDVSEIVLFEIYDDSGFCLANFSNKEDFLNYIFTIRGTVEIKFHTEIYVLSGWIEL